MRQKIKLLPVIIGIILLLLIGIYGDVFSELEAPSFDEAYDRFVNAKTINMASEVIDSLDFSKITDDNVYDLMSATYILNIWGNSADNTSIQALRLRICKSAKWIDKYYTEDLAVIWPPDDGFEDGIETVGTLEVGSLIDRYGYPGGSFLAPKGDDYKKRALAPGTKETKPYYVYKVLRAFEVEIGKVEPWFGVVGEGTQYYTAYNDDKHKWNVQYLLDKGYLEEVSKVNPEGE